MILRSSEVPTTGWWVPPLLGKKYILSLTCCSHGTSPVPPTRLRRPIKCLPLSLGCVLWEAWGGGDGGRAGRLADPGGAWQGTGAPWATLLGTRGAVTVPAWLWAPAPPGQRLGCPWARAAVGYAPHGTPVLATIPQKTRALWGTPALCNYLLHHGVQTVI